MIWHPAGADGKEAGKAQNVQNFNLTGPGDILRMLLQSDSQVGGNFLHTIYTAGPSLRQQLGLSSVSRQGEAKNDGEMTLSSMSGEIHGLCSKLKEINYPAYI